MEECCDPRCVVEANTAEIRLALCPEVRLRLLKANAPLSEAWPKGLFVDEGPKPYWAFAWGSGQALARYVLDHPETVRGRSVVDVGAGSGLVAIAAALAGAAEVTAMDIDPIAVAATGINAALNAVNLTPRLDDALTSPDLEWEVLLAADVGYLRENFEWLAGLDLRGRSVLIADPGRPGLPLEHLDELARFAVRTTPELESPELDWAAVFRLRAGTP